MNLTKALQHARPGARWTLTNEDLSSLQWEGPGDAPTMAELQAAWADYQNSKPNRGWPTVQQFMQAFTMQELAAVELSTDPTLAALRITLSTWLGRVLVSDERVQQGLTRLVQLQIITPERKQAIEDAATPESTAL